MTHQILPTVAGADDTSACDATELRWELNEDLSCCCNLTTLPLPFPLSFASLDTHDNGIAESSWLTDYYNNSCRYRLCDDHDARAMVTCFGVLLLLLL